MKIQISDLQIFLFLLLSYSNIVWKYAHIIFLQITVSLQDFAVYFDNWCDSSTVHANLYVLCGSASL